MPPATPDPKMSYTNISSINQKNNMGCMFSFKAMDGFGHPMASPMCMPLFNESPRPDTRQNRYQGQNSNVSITVNINDFSQNRPQQQSAQKCAQCQMSQCVCMMDEKVMKERFNIDQQTSKKFVQHDQPAEPQTASFKSMKLAGAGTNLTLITQGSDITDINKN